jgi:hypothetical protein
VIGREQGTACGILCRFSLVVSRTVFLLDQGVRLQFIACKVLEPVQKLPSLREVLKGHGFSRAVNATQINAGFSP